MAQHLHLHRPTIPPKWMMPLLVINLFIINLGLSLSDFPSTKLWQDIICKRSRGLVFDELLPEEECHTRAVQRELNIVDVGLSVSATLGGALISLPLGLLSDRIGRIPILTLSILTIFLSEGYMLLILSQWQHVPLRAIWGAGAILLLGGGRPVAEAMVFTTISDVIAESKRATCFQWAVGAVLASQLFGPLIAGRLVTHYSVWHPLYVEMGLIAFGGISLALFAPETLPSRNQVPMQQEDLNASTTTTTTTKETLSSITKILTTLFRRPAVFLLPGTVLVIPVATSQNGIIIRLMPLQFNWSLQQASLLSALSALVTLITLFFLLPAISYLLSHRAAWKPFQRDRILSRASVILFVLGSLFLMIVSKVGLIIVGVIISALGSGVPTLCRSLLVSVKGEHDTGFIFGILAAGEVLGLLVCELVIGPLFGAGLDTWLGLPFCLGMVISIITCVATWMIGADEIDKYEEAEVVSESQTDILNQEA